MVSTNARLFADDVSLFSVDDDLNLSATNLNNDFSKIMLGQINGKSLSTLIPTNKHKKLFFLVKPNRYHTLH